MALRESLLEQRSPYRKKRTSSIEDAWSEKRDDKVGTVEDYTSIIFNLHVWSYRLSQQEFSKYERRAQLKQAARVFDHRHLSMLFRDGSITRRLTSFTPGHQQQQQQQWQQRGGSAVEEAMQASGYTPRQQDVAAAALQQQQQQQDEGASLLPRSVSDNSRRQIKAWKYTFFWKRAQSGLRIARTETSTARSWFGLPMLPVNHPAMVAWSLLMLLIDLTYTAILLPLMFAFGLLHPWQAPYWVSAAIGCLFFVDLFVVLHRGVVVRYLDRHIYIDSPTDVARLYITHGSFWRDLPVALSGPLQLLALIPGDALHPNNVAVIVNTFLLLRGLRLMKLLLLSRELFFGKMGFRHMGHSLYRWYGLSLIYVLAVLINWLSCIMLLVAHYEGVENSWLQNVKGHDLSVSSPKDQYIAAFYWMIISTLTIGYGDISASTPLEQATVVCAVIIGVLFIGYAIKSLMDILVEVALQDEYAQRISTLRSQAGALKVWASWQDLPENLVEPMFRYFMGPWLTNQVVCKHWGNVLQDLPAQLRGQVLEHLLVVKHKELSPLGTRLLANIPRIPSWHILALLQPVPLAPGQQLCWEGEEAKFIWLMQEGSLVALDGVVPNLSTIIDMPGMIVAFDALSWLQQQQQQDGGGSSSSTGGDGGGSRHHSRHSRRSSAHRHRRHRPSQTPQHHLQQQQQHQQQECVQAAAPAPAATQGAAPTSSAAAAVPPRSSDASDTPWATPLASRTTSAAPLSTSFAPRQQQQQQQQQEEVPRGSAFGAIVREISSSRQVSREPSGKLQGQVGSDPAAAAAAAAVAAKLAKQQQQQQQQQEVGEEGGHADDSRVPSRASDVTDTVTRGPTPVSGVTSGPRSSGHCRGVTRGPRTLKYTCSYQAVSTSFFWALPLHQLSLAFEGLPQLLENFRAELEAQQA